MIGRLYGVGVGPGDPELLTLKAARILEEVPVIAYPAPLEGPGLAREIVADFLPGGQVQIVLRFAFTPGEDAGAVYDRGVAAIAAHLERRHDVAFLCEGDPLLYGSFIGVLARLGDRFPVQVVPGVTSLAACSALARTPLSTGDDVLAVVPSTRGAEAVAAALDAAESVAVMKIGRRWPMLRDLLHARGLLEDAWLIERAGMEGERVRPAWKVAAEAETPYFALLLVRTRR